MKFTLTKAKINSTDSQFYYRFKIYYGKGKKSTYIPLNDLKLWNRPETTRQKDENKLNKHGAIKYIENYIDSSKYFSELKVPNIIPFPQLPALIVPCISSPLTVPSIISLFSS